MTDKEYQVLALRTECDQYKSLHRIADMITDNTDKLFLVRLLHSAVGCGSEAGEFLSIIQDIVYYGKPLDKVKIIKELGDLLWYVNQACSALEIDIEVLKKTNIAKLQGRYPERFSEELADRENRNEEKEDYAIEKDLCE